LAAALLGLAGCSSPAALPVDGLHPATGHGAVFDLASAQRLVIVTDGGVDLDAGSADQVTVAPEQAGAAVVSRWSGTGPQAELDLSCPAHPAPGAGPCSQTARVTVPTGAAVTVQARNAGVSAIGLSGPLNLETVNGDVTVVAAAAADTPAGGSPVQLTTRNGSVRADGLRAPALSAFTVNGDVDLSWATAPGQVTADTTNGSIELAVPAAAPAYAVSAGTVHGGVHVGVRSDPSSANRLSLSTVNGSVTVDSGA